MPMAAEDMHMHMPAIPRRHGQATVTPRTRHASRACALYASRARALYASRARALYASRARAQVRWSLRDLFDTLGRLHADRHPSDCGSTLLLNVAGLWQAIYGNLTEPSVYASALQASVGRASRAAASYAPHPACTPSILHLAHAQASHGRSSRQASLELALRANFSQLLYLSTPAVHPINYPHSWRMPRRFHSLNSERVRRVNRITRRVLDEPRFAGRVAFVDVTSLTGLMEEQAASCYDIRHYPPEVWDHLVHMLLSTEDG